MIAILCALPIEASYLRARGWPVEVTGIGAKQAEIIASELVAQGVSGLISWGTAGGLAPKLSAGQLIIPDQILDEQSNIFFADVHLKKQIQAALAPHVSICHEPLLHAQEAIMTVQHKQRLFTQYKAAAADMESAAIAAVAQNAGLPFIALRVIVDSAQVSLPSWFPNIFNTEYQLQGWKFMWQFCRHPHTWLAFIQVCHGFFRAQKTLKLSAKHLNPEKLPSPTSGRRWP